MFDIREIELERKIEFFEKAIELVVDENVDWHAVATQVAKSDPKLFVRCFNKAQGPNQQWWEEVAKEQNYITRIKKVRENTGMGLKEAKDYVDEYFPRREES